jgi:hypothetical protein
MRAYRIFTLLALLATIGSFVLELRQAVHSDKGTEPPNAGDGQSSSTGGASPSETQIHEPAVCDLQFFEPLVQKLRSEKSQRQPSGADRFERLGETQSHVYVYDHANGTLFCAPRAKPTGPIVFGNPADGREANRNEVVFWCCLVIVSAALALAALQSYKRR